MKILFIGDIVGRQARSVCSEKINEYKDRLKPDLIIANVENAAHGSGMTEDIYKQFLTMGIDAMTSGNHIWSKKEFYPVLDQHDTRIIRPANYPENTPGKGAIVVDAPNGQKLLLINIMGRAYMIDKLEQPYDVIDKVLAEHSKIDFVLVDYHAEATSEKAVMSHYLDGRVSALVGTHTHIQTSDSQIMPKGSFFVTDVGMVGPLYSSLGVRYEDVLVRERTQLPTLFNIADGPIVFSAVFIEIDEQGHCTAYTPIRDIV